MFQGLEVEAKADDPRLKVESGQGLKSDPKIKAQAAQSQQTECQLNRCSAKWLNSGNDLHLFLLRNYCKTDASVFTTSQALF